MIEEDDDFRLGGKSSVTSDAHFEYEKDVIEQLNNLTAAVRAGHSVNLPTGPTQLQPFQFEPDPVIKATEPSDAPIAYFRVYYIWPSVHGSMQPSLKKEVMCSDPDEVEDKFFEIIVKSIEESKYDKNTVTTDDLEIEHIEAVHIDSTTSRVYDIDDEESEDKHDDHVHWAPTTPNVTRPTLTAQMRHHGVTMATSPISPSQGAYQQLCTTWSSTPPGREENNEIASLSEAYKKLVESGSITGQEILESVQEQVREQVEAQLIDGPGETKMFVGKEVKGMLGPDPVEEVRVKEAKDNKSRILNFFRNERLNSTMTAFEAEQKLGYHYPI
ncbi:hypothetical protein SEA_TEATEALATTE_1 [Gordonia phage Teatealatte]|uniref:Uncharacterized protein n=2 Tax=Demosthenesvirus katyusha TaxID=1982108 RepID=A0A345MCD8_9CAUD|nr:hypothetical protein SEA_TEATEALATTE_1 [Gordonia phage Teatealatte]QBP29559.1 hypothetical protein SEA_TREDGE_1 [Gordonia phage Tredge]